MIKKISLPFAFTVSLAFILGTIVFTIINNDHSECEIKKESFSGHDGANISTEEHICREIFNF